MPTISDRSRIENAVQQEQINDRIEAALQDAGLVNTGSNPIVNFIRDVFNTGATPQDFNQILAQYGLDTPDGVKQVSEYISQKREQEGGALDWVNDYEYEAVNQLLEQRFNELQPDNLGQDVSNIRQDLKGQIEEYKKEYDREQVELDKLAEEVDNFENTLETNKQQALEDFKISGDLLEEDVEQAQDYAASPSVVDAALETNLANKITADIKSRLADRSRFGGLSTSGRQASLAGQSGKELMEAKLRESLARQNVVRESVRNAAEQRQQLGGAKGNLGVNYAQAQMGYTDQQRQIGSDRRGLSLNKPSNLAAVQGLLDQEELRQLQMRDQRRLIDQEPFHAAKRLQDAADQKRGSVLKGLGALGLGGAGLMTGGLGGLALMGAGAVLGGDAADDYSASKINTRKGRRFRTSGFYGPGTRGVLGSGSPFIQGSNVFADTYLDPTNKKGKWKETQGALNWLGGKAKSWFGE